MAMIRRSLLAALAMSVLAACGASPAAEDPAPRAGPALAPLPPGFEGRWRGVLPCVDCDGVDVTLALEASVGGSRYRLTERYLGLAEAVVFETAGEWQEVSCRLEASEGACIQLVESAQRWFRDDDGSLVAVDGEGLRLDPGGMALQRQ